MNQSLLLHIVERLEGFLHRLPASIQKPVLHELTPLKQLFLQQRAPRFVLTGSSQLPPQEVVATLFGDAGTEDLRNILMEVFRWQTISVGGRGMISLLDARDAGEAELARIREELKREPADVFFHLAGSGAGPIAADDLKNLASLLEWNDTAASGARIIAVSLSDSKKGESAAGKLQTALEANPNFARRILPVTDFARGNFGRENLLRLLASSLPNEARIEMIRISRDTEAQKQVAQTLVKSTTAICTAIGAQPIPLADLPVLTTLQLVMVSGIMYVSGRERSMRAATEFIGALGVNVGAGMVLREGTRALLKFFPGWGNIVCGAVAGAGTYAIGRAAIVFFLEGVSLKDARRTYLTSRKKRETLKLPKSAAADSDRKAGVQ